MADPPTHSGYLSQKLRSNTEHTVTAIENASNSIGMVLGYVEVHDGFSSREEGKGIEEGIRQAQQTVKQARKQLQREGFSKWSFFAGILNTVLTSTILFLFPAYFWIWSGLKCFIFIPLWIHQVDKIYKGWRFVFDFCWIFAILTGFYMLLNLFGVLPAAYQKSMFLIYFCVATGPLGWACMLLKNGLIFHSVEKTASLFIHMTPVLTCWSLYFYNDAVTTTWPNRFPTTAELHEVSIVSLIVHGWCTYVAWLVIHGVWLLTWGVDIPQKKGQETVFNELYKGMKDWFRKKTKSDNLRVHAAFYLVVHFTLASLSLCVWPPLCFKFPLIVLTCFGAVIFVLAAWNSASYYEYILSVKYTKELDKLLQGYSER